MPKSVLFFVCGIAIGAIATRIFIPSSNAAKQETFAAQMEMHPVAGISEKEVRILQEENRVLLAKQKTAEEKIDLLTQQLQENPNRQKPASREGEQPKDSQNQRSDRDDRFRGMMASRVQSRIASIKTAVALTDNQVARIESFYNQRNELMMEMRTKQHNGELTEAEEAEYRAKLDSLSTGNLMKEVLDADQYSDYEEYRKEQNEAELESYASRRLSSLIQSVRLTDDQKNKAYEAFYLNAYNTIPEGDMFSSRRMYYGSESNNVEAQLSPLEGILNEEQMATYRTEVESRAQAFQGGGRSR